MLYISRYYVTTWHLWIRLIIMRQAWNMYDIPGLGRTSLAITAPWTDGLTSMYEPSVKCQRSASHMTSNRPWIVHCLSGSHMSLPNQTCSVFSCKDVRFLGGFHPVHLAGMNLWCLDTTNPKLQGSNMDPDLGTDRKMDWDKWPIIRRFAIFPHHTHHFPWDLQSTLHLFVIGFAEKQQVSWKPWSDLIHWIWIRIYFMRI